jgi:hypothetical protein
MPAQMLPPARFAKAQAESWLQRVTHGPVVAGFTVYLVIAEVLM